MNSFKFPLVEESTWLVCVFVQLSMCTVINTTHLYFLSVRSFSQLVLFLPCSEQTLEEGSGRLKQKTRVWIPSVCCVSGSHWGMSELHLGWLIVSIATTVGKTQDHPTAFTGSGHENSHSVSKKHGGRMTDTHAPSFPHGVQVLTGFFQTVLFFSFIHKIDVHLCRSSRYRVLWQS